jgi:hypothetical protein
MSYKRYNICTRTEPKKEGDKAFWPKVGTLWEREGKFSIELNMFPGTKFYVFDTEKKETAALTSDPPF